MARLHTSGFEENNITATMWNVTDGNATIVTTAPHSGTYHLRVNTSAITGRVIRNLSAAITSGTLFMRAYVRFVTLPSVATSIVRDRSSGGITGASAQVNSSGNLILKNFVTGTTQTFTAALATGTWYRLELRHLLSDTVGEMELRLYTGDSTTADETKSITAEDTLPTNISEIGFGIMDVNATADVYFDDIAINDETGTFQTSWPGPGKTFLIEPNADVSVTFTANPAGSNNANVDDLPGAPDDDTTYNSSATANNEDRLGLTGLGAELPSDADIILLDVYARVRGEGTTAARQMRVLLWNEAGAQTNGPTTNKNDSTAYAIFNTADHLVFDAGTRTKANIDSFDAGYEPLTAHPTRVTALWVNVEWIEAAAAEGWAHLLSQSRNRLVVDY